MPTRRRRRPMCTSSPGAHRSSTDSSVHAMGERFPLFSARSATGLSCSGEPTRHNNSRTPCTPPGWPLPPMETAVGRSTILAAGQPCASIRPRRSWMILVPQRENCGNTCVSLKELMPGYRWLSRWPHRVSAAIYRSSRKQKRSRAVIQKRAENDRYCSRCERSRAGSKVRAIGMDVSSAART